MQGVFVELPYVPGVWWLLRVDSRLMGNHRVSSVLPTDSTFYSEGSQNPL